MGGLMWDSVPLPFDPLRRPERALGGLLEEDKRRCCSAKSNTNNDVSVQVVRGMRMIVFDSAECSTLAVQVLRCLISNGSWM